MQHYARKRHDGLSDVSYELLLPAESDYGSFTGSFWTWTGGVS